LVSSEVTALPEDDDDDDDDTDEEEEEDEGGTALVVIVTSRSAVSVPVAPTRFEMDGRRRRLGRRAGGAGAVREGMGTVVACNCVFIDAPTDLRFEGDLCTESARVNIRLGPEPSVSFRVLLMAVSGRRFEGEFLVGVVLVIPTSSLGGLVSSSSSVSKSNIFANPRLLFPILGVSTKISTSLVPGVGVASGSPVSVSMTPFIADARGNAGGAMRSAGVSN
jgi:hypothetical protein